jgi:photosystem II stability/assembly factor-like uncharacterized protein
MFRSVRYAALITLMSGAGAVVQAQWSPQHSGTDASFRGMSIVNPQVIWTSGTKGTFGWTSDGGKQWHPGQVPGAEKYDFRAVHAFSLDTAVLMVSSQDTALIYRTTNRGQTWTVRYRDASKGAFLDALAFFDSSHGLAAGDPVDGHFVFLQTSDGGLSWTQVLQSSVPPSLPGEGAFAASGTALVTCGPKDAWLGTGGAARSRVFHSADGGRTWSVADTPIQAGAAPAGIFSLACPDARHIIAVGGNYARPDASHVTVASSDDAGASWAASAPAPSTGFLSGVAYLRRGDGRELIAVGTEGSAFSLDLGHSWSSMDKLSLNVVMAAANGAAWAAGAHGVVTVLGALRSGVNVRNR